MKGMNETVYQAKYTSGSVLLGYNVDEVKITDYAIKAIKAKVVNSTTSSNSVSPSFTVMGSARLVWGIVLGFILATTFSESIALSISDRYSKFLFLDSLFANKIVLWVLVFTNVAMFIGKLKGRKSERWCAVGAGISLFVLYAPVCRKLLSMAHYIISSIGIIIVDGIISSWLDGKKEKMKSAKFLSNEAIIIVFFAILFLGYVFLSSLIGFLDGFWWSVSYILAFAIAVFGMSAYLD